MPWKTKPIVIIRDQKAQFEGTIGQHTIYSANGAKSGCKCENPEENI